MKENEDIIEEFIEAGLLIETAGGNYEITEFGQKWGYFLERAGRGELH